MKLIRLPEIFEGRNLERHRPGFHISHQQVSLNYKSLHWANILKYYLSHFLNYHFDGHMSIILKYMKHEASLPIAL